MSHADLDHDGQREFEQRALRNVSWLAAKLGYQDVLDRRQERWLMIAMGVGLVVIVAVMAMSAMRKSSAEGDNLARKRCEVDVRVEVTPAVREQVMHEYRAVAPKDRELIFEDRIHTIVASKCAAAK